VLPRERHIIGESHPVAIERNNSNTRHYLGRFTRKTKVVSRSEYLVNLTLKLWWHLADLDNFHSLASQFRAMLL
jgi:IS1 family transposase